MHRLSSLGCLLALGASIAVGQTSGVPVRSRAAASIFTGLGVDTFAAADFANFVYANKQATGDKKERLIVGFDVDLMLWEKAYVGNQGRQKFQLWLYGETIYGMRSSEVDCSAAQASERPPVCGQAADPFDPSQLAGKRLTYILRNASSLEAYVGLRAEWCQFPSITGSEDQLRLYLKAQAGFLTVNESGGDAVDMHHIGAGVVLVEGDYTDSYFEIGYGRTDLFQFNRYKRIKVDGYLAWGNKTMRERGIVPFAQITVDADGGRGADSIQSYIGVNFELGKLISSQ